jgi:DNA primase
VKQAVTMEMVFGHYHVDWLRKKGGELRGRCPIHKGERDDAFHATTEKNAFHCFSCGKQGNVLDFVAAMEQCTVRDAAVKLAEWFSVGGDAAQRLPVTEPTTGPPLAREERVGDRGEVPVTNPPLAFQLKGVDPNHPYLANRGIQVAIAEEFGVGFFSGKGSMSGRVVIPIHNERGELVAYAGRAIDGTEPKYKLPAGFHKSLELYNLHRAIGDGERRTVVVVEGFFDCMKVHQAGYPCVALIGSQLSGQQEALLCQSFSGAALLFDGDEAGRRVTDECLVRLGRKLWVKAISLVDGQQPDMLNMETIRALLEGR